MEENKHMIDMNTAISLGKTYAKNGLKDKSKDELIKEARKTKTNVEKSQSKEVSQWWFAGVMEFLDVD